jgi:hypothetical protein
VQAQIAGRIERSEIRYLPARHMGLDVESPLRPFGAPPPQAGEDETR